MKIVACNSNRPLAEAVAASLESAADAGVSPPLRGHGSVRGDPREIRGEDVFVIQSTLYPANDNLMELLITHDALRRASARRSRR